MFRKIVNYLGVNNIGFLELTTALFPILAGYAYSPIYLSFIIPLVMILHCMKKGIKPYRSAPLKFFAIYLVIHEISLTAFCPYVGTTPITNMIGDLTHVLVILYAIQVINYEKFKGSIILVAIISSIGILYHYLLIKSGNIVTPIKLPFLPDPGAESRLHEEGLRPVSFFWEPAAYASYMIIPLFISLTEKKYLLVTCFLFFIFLSTSTLGIVMSSITIVSWVFLSKTGKWAKCMIVLCAAVMVFLTAKTNIFEAATKKISETELEETARTINGPVVAENMSFSDFLVGLPDNTPTDYWKKGRINDSRFIAKDELYLSTLWYVIAKLGILGLLLYLCLIYVSIKNNKQVIPIILAVLISMFASNMYIGSQFVFYFTFIYLLKYQNEIAYGLKT